MIAQTLHQAIMLAVHLAAPPLLAALAVGVLVSLIQAVTQINETSLSFLPKIAAVLAALLITAGTAQRLLTVFSQHIFAAMITVGGS